MYASYKDYLEKYRASLRRGSHDGSLGDDQPQPIAVEGDFDYDLIVIGGGSGGLAAAKEAGSADKKVACLDFVKPSPQGTTWSLGGTCVNVGCIPKKLMHQAANLGEGVEDASKYGWKFDSTRTHDWKGLVEAVQNYIHSQNWNCRVGLRSKHVTYINAYGQFVGDHRLKTTNKKGKESFITSRYFLLAMGGRPRYPATPGVKEYCISSDDLFSLPYSPGKTCVIGASYVGLECGGFLAALGMDVTIVVRSILLRGFDQEMAEVVGSYMEKHKNLTFRRPATVTKVEEIEKGEPGLYRVTIQMADGTEIVDTFNTVLVAVGRDPCTKNIGLDTVGVKLEEDGSVVHSNYERTTCPYIYAIGDVLAGKPQLTPVAIQAGKLLARRLFHGGLTQMDYHNIPTVVFTPLEYGCIGLSEADAIAKYGDADIEVYHTHYQPLEWTVAQRDPKTCYVKLICVLSQNRRAVGLHILGPNVGEIVQGFALALRLGATKDDFDLTVGIHPTCAEVITMLGITKRSGQDTSPGSC